MLGLKCVTMNTDSQRLSSQRLEVTGSGGRGFKEPIQGSQDVVCFSVSVCQCACRCESFLKIECVNHLLNLTHTVLFCACVCVCVCVCVCGPGFDSRILVRVQRLSVCSNTTLCISNIM